MLPGILPIQREERMPSSKPPNAAAAKIEREKRTEELKAEAVRLARKCRKSIKLDGTSAGLARAYLLIGTALQEATEGPRTVQYGANAMDTFIDAWNDGGGAPALKASTAKLARLAAQAFDKPLLERALAAGFSWSAIRQLSQKTVTPAKRKKIIADVEEGLSTVAAERQDLRDAREAPGRVPKAVSLPVVLKTLDGRLTDLESTLKRLALALDAPDDPVAIKKAVETPEFRKVRKAFEDLQAQWGAVASKVVAVAKRKR